MSRYISEDELLISLRNLRTVYLGQNQFDRANVVFEIIRSIEKHEMITGPASQPVLTEELWQAIKARMNQEQRSRPDWTPVYSPNVVDPNSTTGQRSVF